MENKIAPVIIFVYARPEHTRQTIESLAKNALADETDVYIYSDAAKNEKVQQKVELVREYIDTLEQRNLFKSLHIIKSNANKGLARSVISGVTDIIEKYSKVIVVEDDLIFSPDFLQYMNDALDFYKEDKRIWSICGYTFNLKIPSDYKHDIYLSYRGGSWGWATWKDRWDKVDWDVSDYLEFQKNTELRKLFNRGGRDMANMLDLQMQGKIDSWAIRWCYTQSKLNMLTVYPIISRIKNIGLDGTGTHSGVTSKYDTEISDGLIKCKFETINLDRRIIKSFRDHFGTGLDFSLIVGKKYLKRLLGI
jgi:hypothetical protein